jgi:hypothetical protein
MVVGVSDTKYEYFEANVLALSYGKNETTLCGSFR